MSHTNFEDIEKHSNKFSSYSLFLIFELVLSAVMAVTFLVVCILTITHG